MHPVVVSHSRPARRLAHLADLLPERREGAAWRCVLSELRELWPEGTLLWLSVIPSAPRGRRSGFRVEVLCQLPTRHSEINPNDLGTAVTLAESHITVALLRLCHRLATAEIRLERDAAGELYCFAYVLIPAALPLRPGGSRATYGRRGRSLVGH
jgi:hypothetical protein